MFSRMKWVVYDCWLNRSLEDQENIKRDSAVGSPMQLGSAPRVDDLQRG